MDDSLKNKILKDFFDSIICYLDESRKNFKQVKTETSFKKIEKNFNLEEISLGTFISQSEKPHASLALLLVTSVEFFIV